jgi:Asp-tRNA(Asn)/Glu-tRNA(Gln) amidotransferase C subunit
MSPAPRVTDADVDRLGELVGLRIDPAERAAVATALAAMLAAADLVMEFPLPEDVHPAPAFRP